MQHTTSRTPLVAALGALLADVRPAFRQHRTYTRMVALVLGLLGSLARHTVTQALLALGAHDTDWSAFYRLWSRQRIRIDRLQQRLIIQTLAHVAPTAPFMLAVDGVAFPRTSARMPGVGWRKAPGTAPFRPGLALAQRFGALHWLPPLEHGYTRAVPLVSYPIFTPKARPAAAPPQTEWAGAATALTTLRATVDDQGRTAQRLVVLADGSYDVVALWKALPAHTTLLVRTARNRALFHLPPPDQPRRGGRRKYGPAAPTPADWIGQPRGWHERTPTIRGHARRVRYRVEGPFLRKLLPGQPLFLVVMGGQRYEHRQRAQRRQPVPVLVNAVPVAGGGWALPLPVDEIVAWLWQRWEVEVAHRELKSGFGVGEMQCWHPVSAVTTIQWGFWLYAVCLLAAYRTWGTCGGPQPPGRWRKRAGRWSFTTLWRTLRRELLIQGQLNGGWGGTRGDWAVKEQWLLQIERTVEMSARL